MFKNAKESGIVNIDLLHKEVRRRNFKCSYDFVVEMVKQRNGYLIDDKHFLAKTSVEKNSLISVIHKTLSVTKKLMSKFYLIALLEVEKQTLFRLHQVSY